jgi:hypothetical protein
MWRWLDTTARGYVTNIYAAKVDKFMVRHFVKPGITGLAQN